MPESEMPDVDREEIDLEANCILNFYSGGPYIHVSVKKRISFDGSDHVEMEDRNFVEFDIAANGDDHAANAHHIGALIERLLKLQNQEYRKAADTTNVTIAVRR